MKSLLLMAGMVVTATIAVPEAYGQNVELWSTNLVTYDDSWQPPSCEWRNEGIIGTPSLHCGSARALRHELRLSVYGPNDPHIRQAVQGCVQQGAVAGVTAGIGAGVATGGSGASAGVQVFINYVATCVGGYAAQSLSAGTNDHSHWVDL